MATAAFVVFATLARQDGVPKLATMWAEDGSLFMFCAYFDPAPLSCFIQPYAGYIHVLPRISALLGSFVQPRELSMAIGVLASLFTGLAAFVTGRAIHRSTGSMIAGVLGGAAIALVYQAGREVGGEVANLHLVYFVASVVIITTTWLGRRLGMLDLALVALFGLSSAFAPLLVPLAVVSVILHMPRAWILTAIVVATAVMQATIAIVSPRQGAARAVVPFVSYIDGYLDVITRGPFGGLRVPPDGLVTVGVVLVLAVLAACWVLRERSGGGREASGPNPRLAIFVVVACVGAGVVAFIISVFINGQANPRYAYIPTALDVEALLLGAALAALLAPHGRGRIRRGIRLACATALPAACVLLVVGFARSFFLVARASAGPDFIAGYEVARAACLDGAARISIRISPFPASSDWFVTIPCDRDRP